MSVSFNPVFELPGKVNNYSVKEIVKTPVGKYRIYHKHSVNERRKYGNFKNIVSRYYYYAVIGSAGRADGKNNFKIENNADDILKSQYVTTIQSVVHVPMRIRQFSGILVITS